ncbi:MAG TPA: hypothetical protein VMT22_18015 [Terriglobales bacterium]|nr:hypothetical protein [Terriglobales bacterium]
MLKILLSPIVLVIMAGPLSAKVNVDVGPLLPLATAVSSFSELNFQVDQDS